MLTGTTFYLEYLFIICVYCRDKTRALCLTSPLNDTDLLYKPQTIIFKWPERDKEDQETAFSFSYLNNPEITGIHPNKTILRYTFNGKFKRKNI